MVRAQLSTVRLESILEGNLNELSILFKACQEDGFCYLDLSCDEGSKLLASSEKVLQIVSEWFKRPLEDKLENFSQENDHGYKPIGQHAGALEDRRDGYEGFRFNYGKTANASSLPLTLRDSHQLLLNHLEMANGIIDAILQGICSSLDAEDAIHIRASHVKPEESSSKLMVLRYPENCTKGTGHNKHTDVGTLTLLQCRQSGLEVWSRHQKRWEAVSPRENCAIINVGDSLRVLAKGRLRSNVHRVIPTQEPGDRYSIAYFLRPSNTALLQTVDSKWVTAHDMQVQKYKTYEASHAEQRLTSVLTGGME